MTSLVSGGVVREVVIAPNAKLVSGGVIREVVNSPPGQLTSGGVVREVVVSDITALASGAVVREVIVSDPPAPIGRRRRLLQFEAHFAPDHAIARPRRAAASLPFIAPIGQRRRLLVYQAHFADPGAIRRARRPAAGLPAIFPAPTIRRVLRAFQAAASAALTARIRHLTGGGFRLTFVPSKARTIPLLGWINTPDADVVPAMMHWPAKEPGDVLDYTVDLSAWLADGGNDVLVQITATPLSLTPGDVAINPPLIVTGGLMTNWLEFGQGGAFYPIEYQVLTQMQRTLNFRVGLAVLADLPQPPNPVGPPVPVVWRAL